MEETCDWDVIIEPPSKPTHKIPDIPKPEKKKQAKSEQTTSKPSRETHISAVISERATGDKSYCGTETKAKNHSPKPKRQNHYHLLQTCNMTQLLLRDRRMTPFPKFLHCPPLSCRHESL